MPHTDTITRGAVTARREWSADPATDPFAYVTDQRCVACDTQVTDDDRGPLYDSATDDGTAHVCPCPACGATASEQHGCTLQERSAASVERDVRAFAEHFPTPNVLRAIALCEAGQLTWPQVADLFRSSTATALAEVRA